MNICTKCKIEKEFHEFYPKKDRVLGRSSHCIQCLKYFAALNKDRISAKNKERRYLNLEAVRKKDRLRFALNKENKNKKAKEYRKANKEKLALYEKERRILRRGWTNQYTANRKKTDPQFKLSILLRTRLCGALINNQKKGSAIRDLGCTISELKAYLESKFQEGMSWDNWNLYGWHIDHIIPLSHFDLTDRDQFLKACHYTNLQPMWAEDNLRKGNRVINPSLGGQVAIPVNVEHSSSDTTNL